MELLNIKEVCIEETQVEIKDRSLQGDDIVRLGGVNLTEKPCGILTNKRQYNVYYIETIESLEKSIRAGIYNDYGPLYYKLALLSYHMGDYNQSRHFCQKSKKYVTIWDAVNKDSILKEILLLELLCYKQEQNYQELIERIPSIKKEIKKEDVDLLHQMISIEAKAYMAIKKYETAIEVLSLLLGKDDVSINILKEVYLQLSICYRHLDQIEKSNELFYQACHVIDLQQREVNVNLLLERAERSYLNKNYTSALEDLKIIEEYLEKHQISEGLLEAYGLMGEIYATQGMLAESKGCIERIRKIIS